MLHQLPLSPVVVHANLSALARQKLADQTSGQAQATLFCGRNLPLRYIPHRFKNMLP